MQVKNIDLGYVKGDKTNNLDDTDIELYYKTTLWLDVSFTKIDVGAVIYFFFSHYTFRVNSVIVKVYFI